LSEVRRLEAETGRPGYFSDIPHGQKAFQVGDIQELLVPSNSQALDARGMDFFKPFQNPPGLAIYQFQYPIVISEEHPILLGDALNLGNFPSGQILVKQSWCQDSVFRYGDQFSAVHAATACQAFLVIRGDHDA
jgi:hypothetical protein